MHQAGRSGGVQKSVSEMSHLTHAILILIIFFVEMTQYEYQFRLQWFIYAREQFFFSCVKAKNLINYLAEPIWLQSYTVDTGQFFFYVVQFSYTFFFILYSICDICWVIRQDLACIICILFHGHVFNT